MRIYLLSHTERPVQAIAAAQLSIGTGKGVTCLDDLTDESKDDYYVLSDEPLPEAIDAFKDACKGHLSSVLEFASFNFFWQDVPIFLLRELIRNRIGASYAEQSLRFAMMDESIVDRVDPRHIDSLFEPDTPPEVGFDEEEWLVYKDILREQVFRYKRLIDLGWSVQDARTVLGVWVPTHITTAFTYRALRDILALRQTSQAHPAWQDAVQQIKKAVRQVHPVLAEELRDICDIQGRCVWQSKLDRPCSACAARGRPVNHVHKFERIKTGFDGASWEVCACGERRRLT